MIVRHRRRTALAGARHWLALALLTASAGALGAQWSATGTAAGEVRYNSNLRLAQDEANEAWGVAVIPAFKVERNTARSQLRGNLRLFGRGYPNEDNLDTNNAYVDVKAHRLWERSKLGMDLGYYYDTSLTSELEDTGLVQDRKRRKKLTAAPNWRWQWTERNALSASYAYTDVAYVDAQNTGLTDYEYELLSATFERQFTERAGLGVTLYASEYQAPGQRTEFKDRGIQVGTSGRISPTLSMNLAVGYRETDSTIVRRLFGLFDVKFEDTDEGATLRAGVEQSWLRTVLSLEASSSVDPSGSGYALQKDRISAVWRRELTELMDVSVNALALRTSSLREDVTGVDRDFYEAGARLGWRLSPQLRLSAGYRYRYQAYDDLDGSAEDNAVDARLSYRWGYAEVSR